MQKSKTEVKVNKEVLIPLLFLIGLILFIGLVLIGSFVTLDTLASNFCNGNVINVSECSILVKESH